MVNQSLVVRVMLCVVTVAGLVGPGLLMSTPAAATTDTNIEDWELLNVFGLGNINQTILDPDGVRLAVASGIGVVIWDTEKGVVERVMVNSSDVIAVDWSPDGTQIVSGDRDQRLKIWDANSGALIRTINTGHVFRVHSVAWSPDGSQLASTGGVRQFFDDPALKIWDAETGTLIRTLMDSVGGALAWSPDGSLLAKGFGPFIHIWDTEAGRVQVTLGRYNGEVFSVAWSPDGSRIVGGAGDNTFRIWDVERGTLIRTNTAHRTWVRTVAWSPDGSKIASGSDDTTVRIWDAETGDPRGLFEGHTSWILFVSWVPDGSKVVSGSLDQTIKIWQIEPGRLLQTLTGHTEVARSVAWSPDGSSIAMGTAGDQQGTVRVYDAASGELLITLSDSATNDRIRQIAWSPDGSRIASTSLANALKLWDVKTGRLLRTFTERSSVFAVAWSPDGREIAYVPGNPIKVWDIETDRIRTLSSPQQPRGLNSVAWSPDSSKLASAGGVGDDNILIWDARTGAVLRNIRVAESVTENVNVLSVDWSPDGTQLASTSYFFSPFAPPRPGLVKIWDVETGTLVRTLRGHTDQQVHSVKWSPDGSKIASGALDKTVRIWEAETGRLIRTLAQTNLRTYSVAWSPDGEKLAAGSLSGGVWVWGDRK